MLAHQQPRRAPVTRGFGRVPRMVARETGRSVKWNLAAHLEWAETGAVAGQVTASPQRPLTFAHTLGNGKLR
ncbi:hypothetical protein GCM10022254_68620 [Actinomadura meridiana]|uniref:Uncharacterized protein n=1 Tax=Actinomadura meridiana TaxID=559626 RepID=A0ABP8CN05_9ACTN